MLFQMILIHEFENYRISGCTNITDIINVRSACSNVSLLTPWEEQFFSGFHWNAAHLRVYVSEQLADQWLPAR